MMIYWVNKKKFNFFKLGTLAGGAADCQYWEHYIAREARKYHLKHGEKLSVNAVARNLVNIMYNYRYFFFII